MSVTLNLKEIWEAGDYSFTASCTLSVPNPVIENFDQQVFFMKNVYPAFAANTINAIIGTGLLNNPFPSAIEQKDVAAIDYSEDTSETILDL